MERDTTMLYHLRPGKTRPDHMLIESSFSRHFPLHIVFFLGLFEVMGTPSFLFPRPGVDAVIVWFDIQVY
jgi:hypothetical protein